MGREASAFVSRTDPPPCTALAAEAETTRPKLCRAASSMEGFENEAMWIGIGLAACVALSYLDYRLLRKCVWPLFLAAGQPRPVLAQQPATVRRDGTVRLDPFRVATARETDVEAIATYLAAPAPGSVLAVVGLPLCQLFVNSPTATDWTDYRSGILFRRKHHENDWDFWVKDSWKATKNLTLSFGLRYDKYGTPYDSLGLGGRFTGGQSGLFGISGTSFATAQWAPYASSGSLTSTEFVGKASPQPGKLIYGNDWNNLAPSIGFAYNVPWLKSATVIRGGYGINYAGAPDFLSYSSNIANLPGFNFNYNSAPAGYVNLAGNVTALNGVVAAAAATKPFQPQALATSTRSSPASTATGSWTR